MARQSWSRLVAIGILISISAGILPLASADASNLTGLQIEQRDNDVHVRWNADPQTVQRAALLTPNATSVQQAAIPYAPRLVALRLETSAAIKPRINRITAEPWPFELPPSTVEGTGALGQTGATSITEATLPDAPVVVLREGRVRGTRVMVIAINPIFEQANDVQLATELDVSIPGARLLDDGLAQILNDAALNATTVPQPSNPLAGRHALKVRVSHAGMQRITGATIAAAGWNLAEINPRNIQAWHNGVPVAIEERGTADGRLDDLDELRFYASTPGDRWNPNELYWFTVGTTEGLRMGWRSTLPSSAPMRAIALAEGVWRNNTFYDSLLPGPDGDHWFAANLQTGPGRPAAKLDVTLPSPFPVTEGATQLVVSGSAYTTNQHQLSVTLGAETVTRQWSGGGNWQQSFSFTDTNSDLQLALVPGTNTDGLELDNIHWSRPAILDFARQGGTFRGVAGVWRYQLANLPPNAELYDVSNPDTAVKLSLTTTERVEFEDGPQQQYLLTGPGTLIEPQVNAHQPVDLATPLNADALYIAPAAFHAALTPLVAHRQAQGYVTRLVDVQTIYDSWSFGAVSPQAIRQFLQYTRATSQRPLAHVILVGDGTSDPLNYTKRNNTNFIPPYLAMVDPWLGETACETCYAQLDGVDPLSDSLPDIALGRLPAKSATEVSALVRKLIDYDTATTEPSWRSRNIYIADNADRAGDFAALAELSIALQPTGVDVQRMYYDPTESLKDQPWRESDPVIANRRTVAALNAGAAFVNYVGHSYYWQWALTDPTATPPYLLGLYDPDSLTNGKQLPVVLEMTCFTSAFQQPAYSGTTIDERLLLNPVGGAVAVWGPTGMGVAHGHDALQRGFYRAFWKQPGTDKTLGSLVNAGFLELFMSSSCCQDTLRTFALLGDPLTVPLGTQRQALYLPLVRR